MAYTVTELLQQAAKRYGDINDGGSFGLTLAQQTHDDICIQCRIAQDSYDTALVAEASTIAIPTTVKRIWSVDYVRSAAPTDSKPLDMRSIRWMDRYRPRWRDVQSGEPTVAIVDQSLAGARRLLLWRTPITSSSPTYPLIRVECTKKQTLVASAPTTDQISSLPECIDDLSVYLEGIWERFARLYAQENEEGHHNRYVREINKLNGRLKLFMGDDVPVLPPSWDQVGTMTT
jgi:hypothetical protein